MAHALTATQITELENNALSMKARISKMRAKSTEQVESLVGATEMATAAFTMGVIDGRWGGVELVGVPLSLLVAGSGHLLGFLGVASTHMHNFANGSLAAYLTTLGNGVGARMAMDAAKAPAAK